MGAFLELVFLSLAALLPIVNPFSTAPLFLAITESHTPEARKEQGKKAVLYMIAILGTFLVGGTLIMSFFGISLAGVRIAGGILIGRVAFRMLYPPDTIDLTPDERKESQAKKDISFFPLAMPSLSGAFISPCPAWRKSADGADRHDVVQCFVGRGKETADVARRLADALLVLHHGYADIAVAMLA